MSIHFRNGHAFDGHAHRPGTSVLVEDDRIAAVGPEEEVRRQASGAEEVDLAGGLVAPGFWDAHVHPVLGGLEMLHCDLTGCSGREEYLDALAAYASAHPELPWIRGGGWVIEAFGPTGPTSAELDAVVPDRPVFLPSTDHHDAWVNSAALAVAGIGPGTPDPPDGWFERDRRGRPTGTVREAAMAVFGPHVRATPEDYRAAALEGQRFLHGKGITAWHDALLGGYAGIDDPTDAYLDLIGSGDLTGRVHGALWWDRHRGTEQVAELVHRARELTAAGLSCRTVKVMMDGVAETFTAAVETPYLGDVHAPCGDRGMAFLSVEAVREAVVALDAAGLQCHFHAIGDRAVHDALGAVAAAREQNGHGERHMIAHLQMVRPEDRTRFAELQVVANIQPLWAQREDQVVHLTLPHLEPERQAWHYPFADLLAAGTRLAAGSDWPVSDPSPVAGMHVAVTRREHGTDDEPLLPEQAIGLDAAFAAYTSGAAFAHRAEGVGVLRPGAAADLVVLDRDPFTGPLDEIGAAEVAGTWVGGRPVR